MGPTIRDLKEICGGSFDLITTLNIGTDLIDNIQILHNLGYYHRDLKPNNIAFGALGKGSLKFRLNIGILDFGNAKAIANVKNNSRAKHFNNYGNRIYSSDNVLKGGEFKKMDDIISIFYILIEAFTGSLPWKIKTKETQINNSEAILKIRQLYPPAKLCEKFPKKFIDIFSYILSE